jgi:hypothetical protein
MKTIKLLLRAIAWCVGSIIRTTFALIVIVGLAFANYNMTIPGTGTSFGSIVVSTVHYAQMLSCDPTTPANCAAVKAASTAPIATDPALVVTESPNSPVVSALNTASLCQALSAEPSQATTANPQKIFCDLVGKLVMSPYANRELMVRGANSTTGTAATAFTGISAPGASIKVYLTDVNCGRSDAGTTAIVVTLNDTSSTPIVIPANGGGGGNNKHFLVPLVFAANTAPTFTSGTGVSTLYCDAQGFTGY